MSPTRIVLLVAFTELFFVGATRLVLHYYPWSSFEGELIRTALRVVTALIYWGMLKSLILSRKPDFSSFRNAPVLLGLVLFLSIPPLIGRYGLDHPTAMLFAVTSLVVAVKEEFLFRGIIQNLLVARFGPLKAVLITSVFFTAWHIGVWTPSLWIFAQIFFASVLLGLVYLRSGSIAAVVLLHAAYDAVFSFTPLMAHPMNENWGFFPLLGSVALVSVWACCGTGCLTTGALRR